MHELKKYTIEEGNSTIYTGINESGENNANWNILESKYKLPWCHLNILLKIKNYRGTDMNNSH